MTLSLLLASFQLNVSYYAPEKSEQGIAAFLGLKSPWQSREYLNAMRRYMGKDHADNRRNSICRCQI